MKKKRSGEPPPANPGLPVAEMVLLTELHPWPGNPRKNDAAVKRVAASIEKFGFTSPIIARRENGEIIAGHTRYKAAKLLKLSSVPVRFLDLTEEQAHQLVVADNKLGELAEWDDGLLANLLKQTPLVDALIMGMSTAEVARLVDVSTGQLPVLNNQSRLHGLAYQVVVKCNDEQAQTALIERLEAEGLTCSALIS